MKISRQVGTASQILNVYAQDFSVSTGAGLINIPATTVSYTWFRNNHSGASTGVGVSTASMGTYTSGAWTQINSTVAPGWYQFGIPNDALLSGDCSALHLRVSTGAFNMAPIPIEIELTKTNNQAYMSSQTIGFVQNGVNVTSYVGSAAVTTVAGMPDVNLERIHGSAVITTAAGVMTTDNRSIWGSATVTSSAGIQTVSTQTLAAAGSNITQIHGSAIVTTAAGIMSTDNRSIWGSATVTSSAGVQNVSTQTIDKTGYSITAISSNVYVPVDWGNVTNKAAYNNLSSTFISTNQSIAGVSAPTAAQVAVAVWDEIATSHSASSSFAQVVKLGMSNVSTIISGVNITSIVGTAAVTSAGGQLRVSTQAIDKTGYSIGTDGIVFASISSDAWPLWGVIDAGTVGNINTTSFTGSTAVLRSVSSSYADDVLAGASLFIYNVTTGAGQRRLIVDNVSTNAIVQVDQWLNQPTQSTAKYVLFATPPTSSSNVPDVNVTKILGTTSPATPGYVAVDWATITNTNAAQVFSNTRFSTQSVTVGGVNVTAFAGSAIVTSSAGVLNVSTQAIDKGGYGVTTIAASITTNANVIQAYGSAIVTSASGQFRVSTQTLPTTTNANLLQIYGSAAVTSASGQLLVSTQTLPTYFGVDWGNVTNKAAYNDLSSTFISTNQSIAGASAPTAAQVAVAVWSEINSSYSGISTFGYVVKQVTSITASGSVNVSSIAGSPVVTTSAGVLLVSTQAIPAFATSSDARFAFLDVSVSSRAASSDSRFANLDGSISSRAASSDARFARLDISVSSRATAGDAMALTSGERATLAGVVLGTTQAEGFRTVNAPGSIMQLQYEILANLTEFSNSGTTRTVNSVTSHAGGLATYQYNSTTPSAITRTA